MKGKLSYLAQAEKRPIMRGGSQIFMFRTHIVLLFLAAALLAGCVRLEKEVTITGSGDVLTQEKDFTGFDKIDASHAFQVDIRQGDDFSVVIRVDDNLVERLEVAKKGDTLKIGLERGRYSFRNATLQAEVTMPALTGMDLSGASHATVAGFNSMNDLIVDLSGASILQGDIIAGDARFDVSGAGKVTLSGSARDVTIDASGASIVDLDDFRATDADVDVSGASSVTIHISGRLDAEASGASHVSYLGNPTLGKSDTSGVSSIQAK